MKKTSIIKNQKGFTLIEIIAVLIILGILAAVAVPKFMDMSDQAEQKAYQGAIAAGMSTCSLAFGKLALSYGYAPGVGSVITKATAEKPGGDFGYAFAASGTTGITLTVTNPKYSVVSSTGYWALP